MALDLRTKYPAMNSLMMLVTTMKDHFIKGGKTVMLLTIVIWVICAFACHNIAKSKNRDQTGWTIAGVLGGIIAVIILALLPSLPSRQYTAKLPMDTFAPDNYSVQQNGGQAWRQADRIQLVGVSGQFASETIPMNPDEWIIIGRDPNACQLVFPFDNNDISRRHCKVKYDPMAQSFVVLDLFSSNGTFRNAGERLAANQPYYFNSGERFFLSNRGNSFEFRI